METQSTQNKTTNSRSGIFYLHFKIIFSSTEITITEFGPSGRICKVLHNCNSLCILHDQYSIKLDKNVSDATL